MCRSIKYISLHWKEEYLDILKEAVDYGLLQNGARYEASSSNGPVRLGQEGIPLFGWEDDTPGKYPDWVKVTFSKPRTIDTVVVYTFGEHVRGRNKEGLKDYELQYLNGDRKWTAIESIKGNMNERIIHQFNEISTKALRLWITASNFYDEVGWRKQRNLTPLEGGRSGNYSRVRSIKAYRLGGRSLIKTKDKEKAVEVETGPKGKVAIFKDKVPVEKMKESIPSSPDYLAEILRKTGYGVTFLSAAALMYSDILTHEKFDIFIHPYGEAFPLGTEIYDYLAQGGHLITMGGRAFTNALIYDSVENLTLTGYNPGIIPTMDKLVWFDFTAPLREQIRMFSSPFQVLKHVSYAQSDNRQYIINPDIRIDEELKGYAASSSLLADCVPFEEEKKYVEQGKTSEWIYKARCGLKSVTNNHTQYGAFGSDSAHFNTPCARWISLINGYDRYGRLRGSAGAMIINYDGLYKGSIWAYFGITNKDLFSQDNKSMKEALLQILDFMMRGTCLHTLSTDLDCYRQGEKVKMSVFVDNYTKQTQTAAICFTLHPLDNEQMLFEEKRKIKLKHGDSQKISITWQPEKFDLDFYHLKATLIINGRVIDSIENGFAVWDEKSWDKNSFKINFHNNYFHDGERPIYICGTRGDALHRKNQVNENPLAWERQYQMNQDYGMSVNSPIFGSGFIPGFTWGEACGKGEKFIPKELIRQMDARVQICQKHKLVFAPCIFFEIENAAANGDPKKLSLAKEICRFYGERYAKVPGIMFYIWDDGHQFTDEQRENFNRFAKACIEGFNSNSLGRKFIVLAEPKDSERIGTRRMFKHITVGNHYGANTGILASSVGAHEGILTARMADMRAAGKSLICSEFDIHAGMNEGIEGHVFYNDEPHAFFALGYSMVLNWKWKDNDHCLYPWGIVFSNNWVPKDSLYSYRNVSLFLKFFKPKYKMPELMFVLPQNHWERSRHLEGTPPNHREIDQHIFSLARHLIELGYVDFGVIDEWDLDKLSPNVKALIYPVPFCPDDKTYECLKKFVTRGGSLFVSGDISYDPQGGARKDERLRELFGVGLLRPEEIHQELDMNVYKEEVYEDSFQELRADVPVPLSSVGENNYFLPCNPFYTFRSDYIGQPCNKIVITGQAEPIANGASGNLLSVINRLGKGSIFYTNDVSPDLPRDIIQAFLEFASVKREKMIPDDPQKYHCFKLPAEDGEIYLCSRRSSVPFTWSGASPGLNKTFKNCYYQKKESQEIKIVSSPKPIALTIKDFPMVMAGFNREKKLTAVETEGQVKLEEDIIFDTNAYIKIRALDSMEITKSEALVIFPQPFQESNISLKNEGKLNILEIGEIVRSEWKTHEKVVPEVNKGWVHLHIDETQSISLLLLTNEKCRDKYVRILSNMFSGKLGNII